MNAINVSDESQNLHLPRILCLHGGGTNAKIFRAQCRVLKLQISTNFRLVFAEAPFLSQPGPDVMSVYKNWAPFKSWVTPPKDDYASEPQSTINAIKNSLRTAIEDDNQRGTGEWVGLLGFSQGAKICASLLFCQQMQQVFLPTINWRFAILLAGSGPLLALDQSLLTIPGLGHWSNTAMTRAPDSALRDINNHVLYLPTVHVHGLQDPELPEHRKLFTQYCRVGTTKLMEWDGDHRVPIKTQDVLTLVKYIREVAYETGVLKTVDVPS